MGGINSAIRQFVREAVKEQMPAQPSREAPECGGSMPFVRDRRMSGPAPTLLWTSQDVAAFLRKSKSWVMHHRHVLPPPIRLGRELRWSPAEIRSWAEAQRDMNRR